MIRVQVWTQPPDTTRRKKVAAFAATTWVAGLEMLAKVFEDEDIRTNVSRVQIDRED